MGGKNSGRKSKQQIESEKSIQDLKEKNSNGNEGEIGIDDKDTSKDDKLNSLMDELAQEKNKTTKKKEVRKNKADIEQENQFADVATISASVGLNIIISRLPNPKPLDSAEKNAFDLAFTNMAKKYYSSIARYGEEVNFCLALGLILIPRMKKQIEEKKDNEE